MISVLFLSGTLIVEASIITNKNIKNPIPPLPLYYTLNLPTDFVTITVVDGTISYFKSTLSNVPLGYDVTNGDYLGWCVQTGPTLVRGVPHQVRLYSSYDPAMPASFVNPNWDKVNYVLNHKIGTVTQIQNVIWYFIEGRAVSDPNEIAMRDAANTYGTGFYPVAGEVIAVLVDGTTINQRSIIEVMIPEEYEGLTPGFWKNHENQWQGYSSSDKINSVFTIQPIYIIPLATTFRQALRFGGGPLLWGAARILLRSAVAALLNAAHPLVNYPLSQLEIISQVNNVLASYNRASILNLHEILDTYNNYGCNDI